MNPVLDTADTVESKTEKAATFYATEAFSNISLG